MNMETSKAMMPGTRSGHLGGSRELEDLKIAALATGCQVTEDALRFLGGEGSLTVHEYATTGGIPLRIGDVYLNIPFTEWFTESSELVLDIEGDELLLRHGHAVTRRVDEVFPLPGYVGEVSDTGTRLDSLAFTHFDRVRLSPIVGCAYTCSFCDLPGRIDLRPAEELLEAARVAMRDTSLSVRHALISGGSPGLRQVDDFVETLVFLVSELSPELDVDVMMSSGDYTVELVGKLVDAGVHGFALNIELFSEDDSNAHIRAKHRKARPYFDETVATAVDLLPQGHVRSLIIPGLEPKESTIEGIRHLASLGADPVISPFRPARGTKLERHAPADAGLLRSILDAARGIVEEHGVALGPRCVPCQNNTLTFPWDVERSIDVNVRTGE